VSFNGGFHVLALNIGLFEFCECELRSNDCLESYCVG
jgi:hypothetical protein